LTTIICHALGSRKEQIYSFVNLCRYGSSGRAHATRAAVDLEAICGGAIAMQLHVSAIQVGEDRRRLEQIICHLWIARGGALNIRSPLVPLMIDHFVV
jgi:hypothetical protein